MIKFNRFVSSLLLSGLVLSQAPLSHADEIRRPVSYGQKVEGKAVRAFTNLTTGILELPKNVINTANVSNVLYGFVGGGVKGMVNFIGRTGVGVLDLITIPLPTKPAISPDPIWRDFDVDTVYSPIFRLDDSDVVVENTTTPAALPATAPTATPTVVPTQPRLPVDSSRLYNEETTHSIDKAFKDKMMK
ncbi:hypothetical protein JCM14076_22300 [Methylosoma difficile]